MREAVALAKDSGVRVWRFGDIFLQDLREYRERNLAQIEMKAIFSDLETAIPRELAQNSLAMGFALSQFALIHKTEPSVAGRDWTNRFFRDCRQAWTPAAKTASSIRSFTRADFSNAIAIERGEIVERDGFYFCDLEEKSQ